MIDMVVQYCVYNDYPVWRSNLDKHRDRFNKIIIYPSRHHGHIDLEHFAKKQIRETWVEPVEIDYGKEDWRQAETIPCLNHVESDWVLFHEQDFFVDDWGVFYNKVEEEMKKADMIGWWSPSHFPYVHPCFLLIKRELLEETNKDFKAHPEIDGCDHFAMITRDVERLGGKISKLQDMGYTNWENAFHMGGLTYPYQNWGLPEGQNRVFGVASANFDSFFVYNYWSRKAKVEQNEDYLALSRGMEEYMKEHKGMKDVNPKTSKWKEFFK